MSLATGRAAAVLLNVQLRTAPRLKATLLATAAIWAVTAVSPAHAETCDSGTQVVDGAGGGTLPNLWQPTNGINVGVDASCELIVRNGGEVRPTINTGTTYIGRNHGSTGVITVTGEGSSFVLPGTGGIGAQPGIVVGYRGSGEMTIADGAHAESFYGYLGYYEGALGTVTVTGAGSRWDTRNLTVGGVAAGATNSGGEGLMTISDGAVVTTNGWTYVGLRGTGTMLITGAGSALAITGQDLFVGSASGGNGDVTIADGATVTSNRGHIGYPGATGSVVVSGGASWTLRDVITLGTQGGTGELLIVDGGIVRMAESNNIKSISVGDSAGTGRLEVRGSGSLLSFDGTLYIARSDTSEGDLVVADGGRLETGTGAIGGFYANTLGLANATVTGAGSVWNAAGSIDVRQRGQLNVSDGGQVVSEYGIVGQGRTEDGVAVVTVSGAGSAWTTTGGLAVGREGAGTLTVSEGGALRVGGTLTIARDGNSIGSLFIGGGDGEAPSEVLFDTGRIAFGSGEGRLVFNYTGAGIDIDSAISGVGLIEHRAGTTTFSGVSESSNFFEGETLVTGGSLTVDGVFGRRSHLMTVSGGGRLGGTGTIGGTVSLADAILEAGNSPGTLTIDGDLSLGADTMVAFELGAPDGMPGIDSDLIVVTGNLTLDGTLNVIDAGAFGAGLYRLFDYGGTLTDNQLDIGITPAGYDASDLTVQTSVANQVNLLVGTPTPDSYFIWDGAGTVGNDAIEGGDGLWNANGTNWTVADGSANGPYDPDALLIFTGPKDFSPAPVVTTLAVAAPSDAAGLVTVDNTEGMVTVNTGVQFAVDGYTVSGDAVTLGDGAIVFRVGDGTGAGAEFVATVAAELTGAGGIRKTDLGTLILTGTNSYEGNIEVLEGVLQGDAASLRGDATVDSDGELVFDQQTDGTFGGNLGGSGRIVKEGSGTLTFTGGSIGGFEREAEPVTDILAGTLALDGTLGGTIRVHQGARLMGSGIGHRADVLAGGTLAPGNSIGTLRLDTVSFQTGSTYEVELSDGGSTPGVHSDLIDSGSAEIAGGTVHVVPANRTDTGSTYTPGLTYTILTAGTGGVVGTFDEVTDDFAFLDFELGYDAANVYLTSLLAGDGGPGQASCPGGLTFNQNSTCGGVLSLGSGELFSAVINLSHAEAPLALDLLSGEVHASIGTALTEDSRFPREAVLDRLADAEDERRGAWGRAFGAWGDWQGDGNTARFERSIGGFFAGGDVAAGETMRFGVFTGYSHTSFDLAARYSSGSANTWHLGVYGGGRWGRVALRAGGAYAWHAVETSRSVAFTGFDDSLASSHDAATAQIFGELAYRVEHGGTNFEPFAGIAYVRLDGEARTETGGAAALAVDGRDAKQTFSTVGLRAQGGLELGQVTAGLQGMVAWRHAFGDLGRLSARAFGGGDSFGILGVPLEDDAFVIDLGMAVQAAPGASISLSYNGQHGSSTTDHGLRAGISIVF